MGLADGNVDNNSLARSHIQATLLCISPTLMISSDKVRGCTSCVGTCNQARWRQLCGALAGGLVGVYCVALTVGTLACDERSRGANQLLQHWQSCQSHAISTLWQLVRTLSLQCDSCCNSVAVLLQQPMASSAHGFHTSVVGEIVASESNLWLIELQTRPMVLLALAL